MQEELSFGIWLRKQRRALDLSRQTFAVQIGCAEVTLRRIEAGTLKPSKELAGILLEKLGISEAERPQWISFARGLSTSPLHLPPLSKRPITNLPTPLTTFIGRKREQTDVMSLIAKHRLVTLTGSGGVGKTRLSIKVGEHFLGNYADGVWLVELAPILDPLLVPRTMAITIGLRDEPQRPVIDMLSDYLREKQMLLVLDNCEHLVDACAQLADTLLKRCPNLKMLATSREVLGILGEATYRVPSLELPDSQYLVEKLGDYESVHLFEERAQLARMDFSVTAENASSVAKICSRLDGIPLAIELAAARVSTFSPEQIAERLQENYGLLASGNRTALPRHQTLQAAIDWSYNLLSPEEQTLFRRLSVFINGWTPEAAESVCADVSIKSEGVPDLLTQLINKSLVFAEETGDTRYRMLETIRQDAKEKLIKVGEYEALCDKHLDYFLSLAVNAEPHLVRPEQLEWLALLDVDYENIRLALSWALSKDEAESSLRLCAALGWFWEVRCHWLEGLNWVTRALAKPYQNEKVHEKVARARALYTRVQLEWELGNLDKMLSPAQASLVLALESSDKREIAIAKYYLSVALMLRGEDACALMEESFAEFQALDEAFWEAFSFSVLGPYLAKQAKLNSGDASLRKLELARRAGEHLTLAAALSDYADWLFRVNRVDEAQDHAEESERLFKQVGSENASINFELLAQIAWSSGDHQEARVIYMKSVERFRLLGVRSWGALCLKSLGLLAMEDGNLGEARIYLEQALIMGQELGSKFFVAYCQTELSNLFYLLGNFKEFKQHFRESLDSKGDLLKAHKAYILMQIIGSLYLQKPDSSALLLGAVDRYENPFNPVHKRYCIRAEPYVRKMLGNAAFKSAFAEGQKMSLDEALDLALKTVEEM